MLDSEKSLLIAFFCIVIYLFITFLFAKSYRKRFDKNFLFANGSLIDFPLILCFLIFWLVLYGVGEEEFRWEADIEKVGQKDYQINTRNPYLDKRYSHCRFLATCKNKESVDKFIASQMGYKFIEASPSEDCSSRRYGTNENGIRTWIEKERTCEEAYTYLINAWNKVQNNPSQYFMPEGHILRPLNYKSGLAKILISISLISLFLLLVINILNSSFVWGIIQTVLKVPLMGAVSSLLIASIFVGGASIAKKRREKKELGKKISKGIANSKKKKF